MRFFDSKFSINSFNEARIDKSVGLAHGTFDLFHYGHLCHLKAASRVCDYLIVSITADLFIKKGPGRPIFNQKQRAEMISAITFVDAVVIVDHPSAVEVLQWLKPEIYIKGSEYRDDNNDPTGAIINELDVLNKIGSQIVFTDEPVFSSSRIINRQLSVLGDQALTKQISLSAMGIDNEINFLLDKISQYNVCIVGESILDSYVSCDALGKVNKDPMLAFVQKEMKYHAGGVISIALHLASLVETVTIVTQDALDDVEGENMKQFPRNIKVVSFASAFHNPRMEKRRFVDNHTSTKVFETYSQKNLTYIDETSDNIISNFILENDSQFDAILVADYGHGMLNSNFAKHSSNYQDRLAVNVQSNAGNRGFNFVSKYPFAKFVSLAEHELRLEMRDNATSSHELIVKLSKRFENWPCICLTSGKDGIYILKDDEKHPIHCPAFASKVVDRVGAGDAVFAISSLLAIAGASSECVAFMGNIAGGLAVGILGNELSLDKSLLAKTAVSLLKV